MRIKSALLALALLVPTMASAQAPPDTSFLRVQRDERREPVALQTVVAKYVPAGGAKGLEIDLVAVVHIGELAYYHRLNKEFEQYDAVLYELVAPEGAKPAKEQGGAGGNPLGMLQQGMKYTLRLEHQLEVVDYHRPNFIHADLSLEGMKRAMKERGEDEVSVAVGALKDIMAKMGQAPDKSKAPSFGFEDLFNPTKMRRMMAQQFEDAGGEASFGGTIDRLLIEDRNKAAMRVLHVQIAAGKKRIAIFYGAAHMPDFDKRLRAELTMRRMSDVWLDAWKL